MSMTAEQRSPHAPTTVHIIWTGIPTLLTRKLFLTISGPIVADGASGLGRGAPNPLKRSNMIPPFVYLDASLWA